MRARRFRRGTARRARPWTLEDPSGLRLLAHGVGIDVVEVGVAQLDVGAAELRGQWVERVGGADGGVGGAVEGLLPGLPDDFRILGVYAAVAINAEGKLHDALFAEFHGGRHDREPIALDGEIDALEVAI